MRSSDMTLYDAISRNALLYPQREAVVHNGERLDCAQFKSLCDRMAGCLLLEGVKKGDRVAVLSRNSSKYLMLYAAAAKVGAILVPINWRAQAQEIEHILIDSSPRLVLAADEYMETAHALAGKMGPVPKCLEMGAFGRSDCGCAEETALAGVPGDGCVLMYTAAVGGKPQGALLSQGNIISSGVQLLDLYGLGPEDCNLCFIPLFHIGGLSMCAAIMLRGGKNVLTDGFDPEEALGLIQSEKVSVFFSFSPMLKMLADKINDHDLSSVRKVSGIESPENISLFCDRAGNARFYSTYGQTECMPVSGCPRDEKPGSIGRPAVLTRVAILDDYGHEVPPGVYGEICVRSPAVFGGYWNMAEDSAGAIGDGWHHTGDTGRFDSEGYLWYGGRRPVKELIKTGGENVYPAEVEKAILTHGSVAEAAVFGVPDGTWGEAVAALVVVKEGMGLDKGELLDFLGGRIAGYKKPRHVIFAESLPKTARGEVDREKIREKHSKI